MSAAAFQATFVDIRFVKGRKVAQLVFETPIEGADAALEALGGVPQPQKETWAAIARINLGSGEVATQLIVNQPTTGSNPVSPAKERRSWSQLSYAEQAGIRCGEPRFWEFLNNVAHETGDDVGNGIASISDAASFIRIICGVASRADIKPGTKAGTRWEHLDADYGISAF